LPVVITRTFSKIHGMAGLRLGYALGSKKLIERMRAHITFAGASMVAIHAALASLEDRAFLERCRQENERARDYLQSALTERGYPVFPSQTNFVMFRLGLDVRELISDLKGRGIRVGRPFPPLTEHCRVSLGTPEQMERFVKTFDDWRQAAAA
jgi:histidinol-phosphate aminotransferase